MSLMDRVREAGNESAREELGASSQLAELKRRMQEVLPPRVIAQMKEENPRRAENEVRAACAGIFEDDPWLAESPELREALVEALIDSLFGLGPLEGMLADEEITEIMVNGCNSLFVERDGILEQRRNPFNDDDEVRALIDRIIGPLGRRVDESSPMVNARLPQGHRVNAIISPLALDGPALTIRKFRAQVISLEEMERMGSIEPSARRFLVLCVKQRKNVAVSGGTGSGKTTLLNALSCEIDPGERILTIEDSAELRFHGHPHVVRLEARPPSVEGTGEVTIRDLVINALRMRPDRIVVGECRGGEALDMLQAMSTGHDGSLTTLHANDPSECIMRLATMVRYAADLPVDVIKTQIAGALDVIVQIKRDANGKRFVTRIDEVAPIAAGLTSPTVVLYHRPEFDAPGHWVALPSWIPAQKKKTSEERSGPWRQQARMAS